MEEKSRRDLEDGERKDCDIIQKYHQDLAKWSRNIDKRYGLVVIFAFFLIHAVTQGPYRSYGLIYAYITETNVYTRGDASKPVAAIITFETLLSPLASVIVSKLSFTWCIFIGSVCVTIGNLLGALSHSIGWDLLTIGLLQGIGYALIYTPHMDLINNYFVKYRNLAFGLTLTGGSLAVMFVGPMFEYIFAHYPWRYAYFAIAALSCVAVLVSPFLLANPKPVPPKIDQPTESQKSIEKKLEAGVSLIIDHETGLLSEAFGILKTHTFHLIWISELIFFWVFTIWCLVFADYAMDKGMSKSQADNLLIIQSVGELIGRLILPAIVDYQFMSARHTYISMSISNAAALIFITQSPDYYFMAATIVIITAANSCCFILINPLMVEGLGESKVTTTFSLASLICGLTISFRPQFIGYFRDQMGTYDPLVFCLAGSASLGALMWSLEPLMRRSNNRKLTTN